MLLSGLAAHLVAQWLIKSRVSGFNSHQGQRLIFLLCVASYFLTRANGLGNSLVHFNLALHIHYRVFSLIHHLLISANGSTCVAQFDNTSREVSMKPQ